MTVPAGSCPLVILKGALRSVPHSLYNGKGNPLAKVKDDKGRGLILGSRSSPSLGGSGHSDRPLVLHASHWKRVTTSVRDAT